ncbi:MAG: 6-carboxytetrahydropterin synthase QueD [Treponema sp.]|nr:6-carboxytetrahydropterin synthase QueD [Treponema sp.]
MAEEGYYQVRVEAEFSAAHFLQDYHGKCENLHGHNYKVYAHARGKELDEGGMLLDFGILKKTLRSVCNELDHTNLNDMEVFKMNPSAERIAFWIFNRITSLMPELKGEGESGKARLFAVDVFETPTSRARYCVE